MGSWFVDVVLGTQTGGHRVVTLVWRPRLGDKLEMWAWVRGWGLRLHTRTGVEGWEPKLGGQDLVTETQIGTPR